MQHPAFTLMAILGLSLGACQPEPVPPPPDPCPEIADDNLAGDWIKVYGARGDHKNRFRITGDMDNYTAYLIPGFFDHIAMTGEHREHDFAFTQVMTAQEEADWKNGNRRRYRMYVEPYKKKCSLRVVIAELWYYDGVEKEKPRGNGYEEFLPFPTDTEFTYLPADEPLFLGQAAKNRQTAEAQMARLGEPDPAHGFGEAIPVGVFSQVSQDGPDTCTYDMDLYFDDQPVDGKQHVPAGDVQGGWRHWYEPAWYAPYAGNHHFELYRYRTCSGKRERIAISGLEAVLG